MDYDKNVDALLDEMGRMRAAIIVAEAQRDVATKERELVETQIMTGATALSNILALTVGKTYVSVDDIRRAIFGDPLKIDGTFGG